MIYAVFLCFNRCNSFSRYRAIMVEKREKERKSEDRWSARFGDLPVWNVTQFPLCLSNVNQLDLKREPVSPVLEQCQPTWFETWPSSPVLERCQPTWFETWPSFPCAASIVDIIAKGIRSSRVMKNYFTYSNALRLAQHCEVYRALCMQSNTLLETRLLYCKVEIRYWVQFCCWRSLTSL